MQGWLVVGDVVASQRFVDRPALLDGLDACLADVNAAVAARVPLARGSMAAAHVADDAFRGTYDDLADVVRATVRLRIVTDDLVLATVDGQDEPVDVRVGIATGDIDGVGEPAAGLVDAAAAARARAQELPDRPRWPPSMRTVAAGDDEWARLLRAHLVLLDQLFARMDARDRRALLGLLDDERQVDIAADLGVTQPAVAKRVRDRGALAIMRSVRILAGDE